MFRLLRRRHVLLALAVFLLLLAACGGGDSEEQEALTATPTTASEPTATPEPPTATPQPVIETPTAQAEEEAYPAPAEVTPTAASAESEAYPAPTEVQADEAYPAPAEIIIGPDFAIHEPIPVGATVVTGTGPVGVPIYLINWDEVGVTLAEEVTVNEDGIFAFELSAPLEANTGLALKIGDLEGTEFDYNQFLNSPTYREDLALGILLDTARVESPGQ